MLLNSGHTDGNEIVAERSEWSDLARRNRDALQRDPMEEWRRLHATPRKLAQVYPAEAAREQLDSGFSDVTTARTIADELAANGDPYFAVSSGDIRPEPRHTTLSASAPASDSTGLTAWVA